MMKPVLPFFKCTFLVTSLLLMSCFGGTTTIDAPVVYNQEPGEDQPLDSIDPFAVAKPKKDPAWAEDIIWYQIFPERFRNGDLSNDPPWSSLEFPENVPDTWEITPWTEQWYKRAAWEEEQGDDFYENGVFDRRLGGDLQGVIDKLDYLEELGISGLYFNPVFYARSLHKYDGVNFHHIDPYFGPDPAGDFAIIAQETADPESWEWTSADKLFLDLLQKAHDKGMRVLIDGVFNHTGRDFLAFKDILKNQEKSEFADWFIVESFDDPDTEEDEFVYKGWWDVHTLPLLANTEDDSDLHPAPKKYFFDITRRWMDPDGDPNTRDGIDGWRLDVAEDMPKKFWNDWHAHVRSIYPDAYTAAEIWRSSAEFLDEMGFSASMNYFGFAFPVKGFFVNGKLSGKEFGQQLSARRTEFSASQAKIVQNLIDSHDTDRVASMIVNRDLEWDNDPDRFAYDSGSTNSPRYTDRYSIAKPDETAISMQKILAVFQMTYVGAPMIYYGTEVGMWGADDPDDRMGMVWPDLTFEDMSIGPNGDSLDVVEKVAFDSSLHSFYKELINLRKDTPALKGGSFSLVYNGGETDHKSIAFTRTLDGECILVLINREESEIAMKISKPLITSLLGIGPESAINLERIMSTGSAANLEKDETNSDEITFAMSPLSSQILRFLK